MTFDEYYEKTEKQLTEMMYSTDDRFRRMDLENQRSFLGRIKVGKDKIYDEARERIIRYLEEHHGENANVYALEDVDQWMCGLAMKKIYGNKEE